jgi:hypothetical protein
MSPISAFTARRARHLLLGAALLSANVLAPSLMAPDTHAAIGGCRSDPIVTLSNGVAVDLHATIDDTSENVQQVSYSLTIPKGTSVTGEVDSSVLGPKDKFQYSANGQAGTYSATVKVKTVAPGKSVSAGMELVNAGSVLSSSSDSGQSPDLLQMSVSGK